MTGHKLDLLQPLNSKVNNNNNHNVRVKDKSVDNVTRDQAISEEER